MVEYLSGNRIQGTSTLSSAPPATSWKQLDKVTLGSASSTLDCNGSGSGFTAKENLRILVFIPSGNAHHGYIYFNGDDGGTNNNYARRIKSNGTDANNDDDDEINFTHDTNTTKFAVLDVCNVSGVEKLVTGTYIDNGSAGGSNSVNRISEAYKWANTTGQITRVTLHNNNGSTNFPAGTELVVLGYDEDESDSGTVFYKEIGKDILASSGDTLNTDITSAKYLMYEIVCLPTGGENSITYAFGTGGGSVDGTDDNYNVRRSNNNTTTDNIFGGAVGTANPYAYGMYSGSGGANNSKLCTGHILNVSGSEKLLIGKQVPRGSEGNINDWQEHWGKWTNTGTITSMTSQNGGTGGNLNTGDYATKSYLRVWGGTPT